MGWALHVAHLASCFTGERERERESAFDNYFAIMEVNAVLSIIIVTYKVNSHSPSKLGITISYILTIKTKYTTFI